MSEQSIERDNLFRSPNSFLLLRAACVNRKKGEERKVQWRVRASEVSAPSLPQFVPFLPSAVLVPSHNFPLAVVQENRRTK